MSNQKKVLITCVGSGVGQSVVDSLKHRKDEYLLIGSDRNRYCYSVPDCDDFVSLPSIDSPDYVEALLGACAERRIDAAIPGHDMELAIFARHRHRFDSVGTRAIVAGERLVALLRNKLAWSAEFGKRTDRVVSSCTVADFLAGRGIGIGFPAIAKPASGSASAGLRIIREAADLAGLAYECIVQPFLFPTPDDPEYASIQASVEAGRVTQASEISVQLAYSRDGELLARFASRNRLKSGVPVEFHPVDSTTVWSAVNEVRAVLEELEPRGPINLQGRITERGLVFFEMNPRFTGITGNRAQFGFNEVALLVDNFTAGARRKLRINPRKVGVRQVASRAWPQDRFQFTQEAGQVPAKPAVLVLGASSWLARHFVADRSARGEDVIAVCRDRSLDQAQSLYARFPSVEVLGRSSKSLRDAFGWADVVVNCVSGRPPHGAANIAEAHLYQMGLLELAESSGVSFVINISSRSVYGPGREASGESVTPKPTDLYSFSKLAIEEEVRGMTRRLPSISSVSLRLARLFGPAAGLRREEFAHRAVEFAVTGQELEVSGPATVLDLLDLRDAVRAISHFVDRRASSRRSEVFNVGSGRALTVGDYVAGVNAECRRRLGRPLRMVTSDADPGAGIALDASRIAATGWSPAFPLEQTIADLFDYFANAS